MNELKIGFTRLTAQRVADLALKIHTALTTPPGNGYFPAPEPTPAVIKASHDALEEALSLETTPSSAVLRKSRRDTLAEQLTRLAANLELTADGDRVMLAASGFELKKGPGARTISSLPAPKDVRVKPTGISGQVLLKCRAVPGADNYQPEYALGPDGPWTAIDPSSNSQATLFTGLARGKDYYFRLRANGPNGPGAWSDIATMMVV